MNECGNKRTNERIDYNCLVNHDCSAKISTHFEYDILGFTNPFTVNSISNKWP